MTEKYHTHTHARTHTHTHTRARTYTHTHTHSRVVPCYCITFKDHTCVLPWYCMVEDDHTCLLYLGIVWRTDITHAQRKKITHVFCTLVLYIGQISYTHKGEISHVSVVPLYCITRQILHTHNGEKWHTCVVPYHVIIWRRKITHVCCAMLLHNWVKPYMSVVPCYWMTEEVHTCVNCNVLFHNE